MFFKVILLLSVLYVNADYLNKPVNFPSPINLSRNNNPKPKLHIVHYLYENEETKTLEVSNIGIKNLGIEYKRPDNKPWMVKSLWDNNYNKTGWSTLEIETNENFTDIQQAYAAGFMEGHLTRDLISLHILNTVGDFCADSSPLCDKINDFLNFNFLWMSQQAYSHPDDPYWHQVNLTLTQLIGLYNGYTQNFTSVPSTIDEIALLVKNKDQSFMNILALQLNGDLGEIMAALNKVSNPFYAASCSALIKVLPDNADLFASHDTWTEFESMLRILKLYKFKYHFNDQDPVFVPGTHMTFSSYPGIMLSIDDYYITNANLTVIETTIGNSNADLWKYVTPATNLYWIRILVANRLSYSGVDWAKWFSLHNSGTYNNQWMIVDYKKFTPHEPLEDNLLVVLEQIPGNIVWEDKTDVLRTDSYWSSYNIPYYPYIYNISGVYDAYVKYGDFFSYSYSPRGSIFRRDHSKVVDVDSMIKMMRYNDYTNDEFSKCSYINVTCNPPYSSENTIAARSDLNPANGVYPFDTLGHRDHGATDMKLTTSSMVRYLEFVAISGPTWGGPNIPPFQWSTADFGNSTNHFGHPDKWTFDPIYVQWNL